jgi:hypothetical protein
MSKAHIKQDRVPVRATTFKWVPMGSPEERGHDTEHEQNLQQGNDLGGSAAAVWTADPQGIVERADQGGSGALPEIYDDLFEDDGTNETNDTDRTEWADGDVAVIDWYGVNREELPSEPFQLGQGKRVIDPQRFYGSLDSDIEAGPESARATGLIHDLMQLQQCGVI